MSVLSVNPEPWSSHIDVLTAAQWLESAIHAQSPGRAADAIALARKQIQHAQKYLSDGGYAAQAKMAATVASQLSGLQSQAAVQNINTLSTFQSGTLYSFQGVLAWLDMQIQSLR